MGAIEEQWGLISAFPDWAALQSCLFIQSSRLLRKWLCLFPSVSCEPWAKYTHTTASQHQHPPWNSTPHFAGVLSAKAIRRIHSRWKSCYPPPQEKELLEVEMKCCSGQECTCGGWAGQSLVLYVTKMRMFPPPWNDCSWTVSALCLRRDRAVYSNPAPEPKMSCGCQPSTSGKFPLRVPGLSHFGYNPSVPGFIWDI